MFALLALVAGAVGGYVYGLAAAAGRVPGPGASGFVQPPGRPLGWSSGAPGDVLPPAPPADAPGPVKYAGGFTVAPGAPPAPPTRTFDPRRRG